MPLININHVHQGHEAFMRANRAALKSEFNAAGQYAQGWVMKHPFFKPGPNQALQRATKFRVAMGMGGGKMSLTNAKEYAAAIDKGARPHFIWGRWSPVLRFYWAKLGRWMVLRYVNHPGNRPYSFLYDAWTRSAEHFLERMGPRMRQLAKRF